MKIALSLTCMFVLLASYYSITERVGKTPSESLPAAASRTITTHTPPQKQTASFETRKINSEEDSETISTNPSPSVTSVPALPLNQKKDAQSLDEAEAFELKLKQSTYHSINGEAMSDLGKLQFDSQLLPTNEVQLQIDLSQSEAEQIELHAYFDLANFTMTLDGRNSILTEQHKNMLRAASDKLQTQLGGQYEGFDFPDHGLMLVQMLAYWSMSPEGYVQQKRTIVSR